MMTGMKSIRHTMRYDGVSTAQVFEMIADPTFREAVCEAQEVVEATVDLIRSGDRLSTRIEQVKDTRGVPSFVKKFAGAHTKVIQEEEWSSPTAATVTVTLPGKPGRVSGTVEITERAGGVDEIVALDISTSIPLIGGRIESFIGEELEAALAAENATGKEWLAR